MPEGTKPRGALKITLGEPFLHSAGDRKEALRGF